MSKYNKGKYRIYIAGDEKIQNKVVSIVDDTGEDALGGGQGTMDYSDLENKPTINNVELDGELTSQDLGVYSKPQGGIPESDLSSGVQQALQKHFKGWWPDLATLKAAHTATEGDSAYVKDASPATTWSIYVYDSTASTDNYWADSGTDADTSKVQTFASGEEVNEVHIVNDLTTGGATDVLSAEQGLEIAKNKQAREDLTETTPIVLHEPKNWIDFDSPNIVSGKFITQNGTLGNGSNYTTSGYIPVKQGETYKLAYFNSEGTAIQSVPYFSYGINEYNEDKSLINTIYKATGSQTYTPSSNDVKYMRFSCSVWSRNRLEMYYGSTPTRFSSYFEPYTTGGDYILKDGAVKIKPFKFNGWQNSDEISPTNSVKIDKCFRCRKGFVATAYISGTIEYIRLHVMDWYLDIDQTNLSVSPVTGSTMLVYPHGLQLGQLTTILVDMGNGNNPGSETTIKIFDADGNGFTKTNVDFRWADGYVQLDNNNTNGNLSVKLSAFNKNLNKKIWLFGDSYLSYGDPSKWITKMFGWGYNNLFLDQMGGETAKQSFNDLSILIESGVKPSYIVWCLGMNGGTDSDGQVNSTWLSVTQQLIELCESIGCELILATIPSTPSLSHVKLNEWVRNSDYRYIDFAAAVEDGVGTYPNYWRLWGDDTTTPASGSLLSSDKVHPTQYGAVELAARVLVDFPEITVID
jgi:hypothetical protein